MKAQITFALVVTGIGCMASADVEPTEFSQDFTQDTGASGESSRSEPSDTFGSAAASKDAGPADAKNCAKPKLVGTLRDFRGTKQGGHPDFEADFKGGVQTGIVEDALGADRKPVFKAPKGAVTSRESFNQWFRDTPNVNRSEDVELPFTIDSNTGRIQYESNAFFPLDDKGFGNTPSWPHNFHFTYELHTEFQYKGDEVFNFRGDDDVWVFVNRRLVVDLGGIHGPTDRAIALDTVAASLGLVRGANYDFDFFFAERHTNESNFKLETTIKFQNCDPILPR
jgi:fibro-slime domain-containing protein